MALVIITDSASDLPKDVIKEYGMHVIPTPVVIDGKDYFDGETIQPEEFYDILRKGVDVKTYHINAYMFRKNFEPYAKRGDEVIYICFSTGIAGTFGAANLAKKDLLEEYPDFDLTIVDSKCASLGFGLVAIFAHEMQRNGVDKQTILEAVEYHCQHAKMICTVNTLEYLFKGGRLNRVSFVAGGVLDIKPIIEVDETGALKAVERVRSRKKALHRLVQKVGELGRDLEGQTIGVVHGDDYETLCQVKGMLTETYGCKRFVENYIGCAIGAHTGPGIIGITFLDEASPYRKYFGAGQSLRSKL